MSTTPNPRGAEYDLNHVNRGLFDIDHEPLRFDR